MSSGGTINCLSPSSLLNTILHHPTLAIPGISNNNPIPKVWASMQGQSLFESCAEGKA